MKKAIKLFVAIVVTIGTFRVNANEKALKVNVVGEKKFRVVVTNIQGLATSYIKDDLGQILYKSKSKENIIRLTFDLSKLENGNYSLMVEDDHKVQKLPVTVTEAGIEVKEDQLQKNFFPILVQNDENVLVKLLANDDNDLFVNIKTRDGQVLLADKVEGQLGLIGKKYSFTPGEYMITMISDDFAKTSFVTIK